MLRPEWGTGKICIYNFCICPKTPERLGEIRMWVLLRFKGGPTLFYMKEGIKKWEKAQLGVEK